MVESGDEQNNVKQPVSPVSEEETEGPYCFFCGMLPKGATLIEGVDGPICSTCVFSLSARLTEEGRDQPTYQERTLQKDAAVLGEDGELPAHQYQNRADLAAAYLELGKKHMALEELFGALESALICQDWAFALHCVGLIRNAADSPTIRDRIHQVLELHIPEA
jgi:hypothetical protein